MTRPAGYEGLNALIPFWEYDKIKPILPRGLRGYRKYKNGLLNVTPIEGEIELVQRNAQESPLLRLPPEIRALIWEFTIGGNIIRPDLINNEFYYARDLIRAPQHRFSLLQVSRQIYFEAAILVWKLSTFRFHSTVRLQEWLHSATQKARNMIHIVELGADYNEDLWQHQRHQSGIPLLRSTCAISGLALVKLPNLERIDLQMCEGRSAERVQSIQEKLDMALIYKERKTDSKLEASIVVLPKGKSWRKLFYTGEY